VLNWFLWGKWVESLRFITRLRSCCLYMFFMYSLTTDVYMDIISIKFTAKCNKIQYPLFVFSEISFIVHQISVHGSWDVIILSFFIWLICFLLKILKNEHFSRQAKLYHFITIASWYNLLYTVINLGISRICSHSSHKQTRGCWKVHQSWNLTIIKYHQH
jgi:hypothetical protein